MNDFLAFIKAMPQLIDVLNRFLDWQSKHDLDAYMLRIEDSIDRLEKAISEAQKIAAARDINDAIRKL